MRRMWLTGLLVLWSIPSLKLLWVVYRETALPREQAHLGKHIWESGSPFEILSDKLNNSYLAFCHCSHPLNVWPRGNSRLCAEMTGLSAARRLTHTQTDKASAVPFPAYRRIRRSPVLYLYAWFPLLCVICDVEQVTETLVGDELVVRWDNACVSPRRRVSLFLFPLQPPLLLQDFLPGNQTEVFEPADMALFYSFIHVTHSWSCIMYDFLIHNQWWNIT